LLWYDPNARAPFVPTISDHEIVAVADSKPDRGLAILKLDAGTGEIAGRISFPASDHAKVAIHAKRKVLAAAAIEWYGGISVFDLETMTLVREIPNPNKRFILNLAWDATGTCLVFRLGPVVDRVLGSGASFSL